MSAAIKLKRLAEVSVGQWGLVTTAQASNLGVDRLAMSRLGQSGHLERVRQGVYRDTGVAITEFTYLQAEWLMLKPDIPAEIRLRNYKDEVVVGSTTAAWLYQAGDFRPTPFTFYSAKKIQRAAEHVRNSIRKIKPEEITLVQGLPTTTPERTLQDLVHEGLDFEGVKQVASDLHSRITMPDQLITDLARYHKTYGMQSNFFNEELADALQFNRVNDVFKELRSQSSALSEQLALVTVQIQDIELNRLFSAVVENLKQISNQLNSLTVSRKQEQRWQVNTETSKLNNH